MESIRIDTGVKRILINDGPEYIEFNPSDLVFAEKFYNLAKLLEEKQVEYKTKFDKISSNLDDNEIPPDMPESIAFMREVCEFMRAQIDSLFGPNTSKKLFGDALVLEVFPQFFKGILPFVQTAREKKVNKYIEPAITTKRKKHSATS